MPTTCRARTERCLSLRSSRIVYRPTHSPRCGRRSGLVRLVGDELAVTDIGSQLTYSRVTACYAAPTPDICHRQTHASGYFGHSHCALHLNPVEKVLCAFGWWLGTNGVCGSAYGILRCNLVSAPQVPLTPDWRSLHKPNAQSGAVLQRLCRASGTLSAVNRLVLHSHSLQAQFSRCARGCRWR